MKKLVLSFEWKRMGKGRGERGKYAQTAELEREQTARRQA